MPIYKKGDKTDCNNYTDTSLVLSSVMTGGGGMDWLTLGTGGSSCECGIEISFHKMWGI